jgi:hypothetical protein
MKEIRLKTKSKKTFRAPAIFVMPKNGLDILALREANMRYPKQVGGLALEQIDGIVVNLKDQREMWAELSQTAFELEKGTPKGNLTDRIKIVNPGLDFLLRGNDADRDKMKMTGLFDPATVRNVERIAKSDDAPAEKAGQTINEVYPKMHAGMINSILKYQIDVGADIIMFPTVPISSTRYFTAQIGKVNEMLRASRVLLDSLFSGTVERRDTMSAINVDARFLAERKYAIELAAALFSQEADHIGVNVSNLDRGNETQVQNVFDFMGMLYQGMQETERRVPLHLMNVDQFGYMAFCYGVSTLTMPLASDPFFYSIRHKKDISPVRKGVYYYPSKMQYVTYDKLLDLTRSNNYRLPCHCAVCEDFGTVFNAEATFDFNEFRRIHDVLYKNIENKMLREPRIPFTDALRDLLSRSRPAWTQYIPAMPMIAF